MRCARICPKCTRTVAHLLKMHKNGCASAKNAQEWEHSCPNCMQVDDLGFGGGVGNAPNPSSTRSKEGPLSMRLKVELQMQVRLPVRSVCHVCHACICSARIFGSRWSSR